VERKELKMYSDYKSPFAYLAFDPAFALEERFAVRVRWIPFQLRIKDRGQRSAYSDFKAKYSYLDARRWAKPRGILIRAPQKVYDTAPALIGGLFAESKGVLLEYSRKAYELFFRREFEADDAAAVGARAYASAQAEAAADNVFGVPLFFFEREPFWGHDRLPVLEERLVEAGLSLAR
jgi:2-hydroxychromene-2-carboxylate isomerase